MPVLVLILLIFSGLIVGFCINYLADILPNSRRLTHPTCLQCEEKTPWGSYFFRPARCPHCGERHRHRYRMLFVYLVTIVGTVWLWFFAPEDLGFLLGFLLMLYFLLIIVIDVEHRLILIPTVIVGVGLGLIAGFRLHGLQSTLIGGLAGYLIMFVLYKFGEVFIRLMSRMQGEEIEEVALGYGDVNLAGVLGLILGWPVILIGLVLAVLAGGVIGLIYLIASALLRRYRSFAAMPYAPFLVLSAAFLIYFPVQAKNLLLNFFPLLGG